jgi:hypothetical protein
MEEMMGKCKVDMRGKETGIEWRKINVEEKVRA